MLSCKTYIQIHKAQEGDYVCKDVLLLVIRGGINNYVASKTLVITGGVNKTIFISEASSNLECATPYGWVSIDLPRSLAVKTNLQSEACLGSSKPRCEEQKVQNAHYSIYMYFTCSNLHQIVMNFS